MLLKTYKKKVIKVKSNVGLAKQNILNRVRLITQGQKGIFDIKGFTEQEVLEQIEKVKDKESMGIDLISYRVLKKLSRWVTKPLTHIINISLEIGYYPKRWKKAKIIPVYKG